ncbi:MAG TPA: anti-sigma factor, partial [Caulobacteraceae bacterium]|nr:anti-sigma factor [Caulobacteraceae bacterium]
DKQLLLNALVDGELDAGHALDLEAHIQACPSCAEALAQLRAVKSALSEPALAYAAPPAFRQRALEALEEEMTPPRRRRGFEGWFAGGSLAAVAASLVLLAVMAPFDGGVPRELVEGHIRSLQAQHLVDVATSDRHTVKPWFNGKIDFAPPVVDLAAQGFPLAGGRLDYLHERTVAALVYRRRAHVINLYVWPGEASATPAVQRREGYTLVRWGRGGLVYWAVSDIDPADLRAFQKAFAGAT